MTGERRRAQRPTLASTTVDSTVSVQLHWLLFGRADSSVTSSTSSSSSSFVTVTMTILAMRVSTSTLLDTIAPKLVELVAVVGRRRSDEDESDGKCGRIVVVNKPSSIGGHVQGRFGARCAAVCRVARPRQRLPSTARSAISARLCSFSAIRAAGHTLVAMLLDAHPDIVVSNEYNLLEKWDKFETVARHVHDHSQQNAAPLRRQRGAKSAKKHAKNEAGHYNYRVPGAWQGRWRCLRVIGDKKGSSTTAGLQRNWDATLDKIAWMRATAPACRSSSFTSSAIRTTTSPP
jgi:hypothetical protein